MATRNRAAKLARTLAGLRQQDEVPFEIIVVDDGSDPPLSAPGVAGEPVATLRTSGIGRSAARNLGARAASGRMLVFVDDDISVGPDFLSCHTRAHEEWPDALVTGAIRLPAGALDAPFGSFRQRLEDQHMPTERGVVQAANFCAAGNMSIGRDRFLALEGFDPELASAEDQDLAVRHCANGGRMVYLPEAIGIHNDDALDIRSYCCRMEWGAQEMIPFLLRHPDRPENRRRQEVNGPVNWRRDNGGALLRKSLKRLVALRPTLEILFAMAFALERRAPGIALLDRTYRLLLGAHILRGHVKGLLRVPPSDPGTSKPPS